MESRLWQTLRSFLRRFLWAWSPPKAGRHRNKRWGFDPWTAFRFSFSAARATGFQGSEPSIYNSRRRSRDRCLPWLRGLPSQRAYRRRVDFRSERLARRVLTLPYVYAKRWLEVGIANRNERAVANVCTKHVEVSIAESAFSLVEHLERFGLIRLHSGDCSHQHCPGFICRTAGLLSEGCERECNDCGRDCRHHEFADHRIPPVASSDEGAVHAADRRRTSE